jgi:DNA polymerase III epsilon subunit-like protein
MKKGNLSEMYISVDIETAGPNPGRYSLLSIGACTIDARRSTFYVEVQPVNNEITPESFAIHRLDLEQLRQKGLPPRIALEKFESWILSNLSSSSRAIFTAFNAPFDWMFINDYFHKYLGRNPFGHSAIDIKSFFMGLTGVYWSLTSMRFIGKRYLGGKALSHNALEDALNQADIFEQMLAEARSTKE